jgi:hypothetical protein
MRCTSAAVLHSICLIIGPNPRNIAAAYFLRVIRVMADLKRSGSLRSPQTRLP